MKKYWVMVMIVLAVVIGSVSWIFFVKGDQASRPKLVLDLPTGLPVEQVCKNFRESLEFLYGEGTWRRKIEEFQHWSLELSNRKLLEGMSENEVRECLGKPGSITWTPVNRKYGDNDSFQRFFVKKADYWIYAITNPDNYEKVGFAVAFYKGQLHWSTYQRGLPVQEPTIEIYTDYIEQPPDGETNSNRSPIKIDITIEPDKKP